MFLYCTMYRKSYVLANVYTVYHLQYSSEYLKEFLNFTSDKADVSCLIEGDFNNYFGLMDV